jgi:hypothetical protein
MQAYKRGVISQGNGGMDVVLARPTDGATIATVERHIAAQYGQNAAASTRWLDDHAQFFGGTGIQGEGTTDTDVELPGGTIYALDTNAVFTPGADPTAAPKQVLHITGAPYRSQVPAVSSTITITMSSSDNFRVTSTHLGRGQYLIRNVSDTLHFASFAAVKPGTTDADMTRVANQEQQGQPPTANPYLSKPGVNAEVVSPGRSEIFDSALLTPGTYDLECYIADDETGMPHFFMGMHKIVVIP